LNHAHIITQLEANHKTFEGLLSASDTAEITWRPAEKKWCLLEIACHLYDEEREDFRARLKHALETPDEKLPSIDPEGWVASRKYMEQDYNKKVADFLHEREQSVAWLRGLQNPAWKNAHRHPKFGPLSAEMFLANWLAHDYLHIRQIIRLRYHYLQHAAKEVSLRYAGEW
jgi:hypothetical protein